MENSDQALLLTRRDPARNMARFYALSLEPSLFNDCAVLRRWGRIGTKGRQRIDLFATRDDAMRHLQRIARLKQRRGYQEIAAGS